MITGLYAALSALILVGLSVRIISLRRRHRVGIGDGGHDDLARAIRVQGNFVEYTPLALIVILALEGSGGSAWLVHAFGIALVLARAAHAFGLTRTQGTSAGRTLGMTLTFLILIVGAVLLILDQIGIGLP